MKKINVLIIDDSAVVRDILTKNLNKYPFINIVGSAIDPYVARNKIAKLHVDVITLDIEMPRMDGLTFLKYLMKYYPIPTIIVSSLTDKQNKASIQALELGAVDIIPKPGGPYSVGEIIELLAEKIQIAAQIDFEKYKKIAQENLKYINKSTSKYLTQIKTTNQFIAVGASTGGTQALERLFKGFDSNFPPTAAVIHMPEKFTLTFAKRLNDICPARVKEAENNDRALNGYIYIAPGNYHLIVKRIGAEYILKVKMGPRVHNQRPSVDVFFKSAAENIGKNCIGVLLTGMGSDGADGLLEIKNNNGFTIAQDKESSIVFGMPKAAIEIGAAQEILSLNNISERIKKYLQ